MTRRVDEVDEVRHFLCHFLRCCLVGDDRLVLEKERDGTGFHRDASFLLLLTRQLGFRPLEVQVIHVSDFSGEPSGDDAVGAN